MPKKVSRAEQRKADKAKADRLCGEIVRGRGYCEAASYEVVRCSSSGLQWCHIVGRANLRLRWEMFNALSMCAGHHVWFTNHPIDFAEFVRTQYPAKWALIMQHRWERFDGDYEKVLSRLRGEKDSAELGKAQ